MTFRLKIIFSLTFALQLNTAFGQGTEKDTGMIYHIAYHGYTPNNHDKTLFWHTNNEVPQTHFIVELFCWNRWVAKGKVSASGKSGKHNYRLKVLPHSGENIFRVVLVNDSNVRIASSRELHSVLNNTIVPIVKYTDKKGAKEVSFNYETDYEIHDSKGTLVKEGRGTSVSYADLGEGTYTLYYDNSSYSILRKK
jgi:hypothetical protein